MRQPRQFLAGSAARCCSVVAPSASMRSGAAPPVYTGPGAMAFTRTPLGLNSAAQARVIDARAAFVAPYAAPPVRPIWPAMLLTLMMLPLPLAAIPGANAATDR